MDIARLVPVAAAAAVALGAIHLLVAVVRSLGRRGRDGTGWPLLAWGAAILLQQAAFGLGLVAAARTAASWTPVALVVLAGLVAALAAAPILLLPLGGPPAGEAPDRYFAARGRRAPAALAIFNAVMLVANREVWSEGPLTESARVNLVLLVVALAGFLGGRARVTSAAALAYGVIVAWALFETWRGVY